MRLVGFALLTAWVLAWWASPKGEPAPASTTSGGMAIAGSDRVAVAWLELPPLRHASGRLHVGTIGDNNAFTPLFDVPAASDTTDYRLAETGDGRFVLATEYPARPSPAEHAGRTQLLADDRPAEALRIVFERFSPTAVEPTRLTLVASPEMRAWQFVAAGDQITVVEDFGSRSRVWALAPNGNEWLPPRDVDGHVLLGASGGQLVRYEVRRHGDDAISIRGTDGAGIDATTRKPDGYACLQLPSGVIADGPDVHLDVTSVVPLRGGWARLSRNHSRGCVDGVRDGVPFLYANLDLSQFERTQLSVGDDGKIAVWDTRKQHAEPRVYFLPTPEEWTAPRTATPPKVCGNGRHRRHDGGSHKIEGGIVLSGMGYRLFGRGDGTRGIPSLYTKVAVGKGELFFERLRPDGSHIVSSQLLGPEPRFKPDYRPVLRPLAAIPLLALLFGVVTPLRLLRRLKRLRPIAANEQISAGVVTIEGTLARDADAPEGGLRLHRGQTVLHLFIDGADVLRATEVRPKSEPGGDAVDVASGAPVCATGIVEHGHAFRGDDTLHARRGNLVLVGCTLAEARARVTQRLAGSVALLATAAAIVLCLAVR